MRRVARRTTSGTSTRSTAPTRRRRPAEDEEEEEAKEEEERPRRRSASKPAPPTRRRHAQRDDDDDDDDEEDDDVDQDEDDEDEEANGDEPVRTGWGGYKETKAKGGAFADYLQLEDGEKPTLIKFLEAEPFASYRVHWVEGLTSTRKKSWICIEDSCPLCDAGDDPSFKIAFNIVILNKGKPRVKVWEVGPRMAEAIESKAKDKRSGPLDRDDVYFAASRTGKKQKTQYHLEYVKERDVEEDFGIELPTERQIDLFKKKLFDRKVIKVPTRKQLQAIAEELLEDEGFDDDDDD